MGIGGMWPNGVALVSEAWTDVSRPFLSGLIGTSANLGFMVLSALSIYNPITPENWRWVFIFGAAPVVLGLFAMMALPESPSWLQNRENRGPKRSSVWTVLSSSLFEAYAAWNLSGGSPADG